MTRKKVFFSNFNNLLNHVMPLYSQTTNLLDCDAVVSWNDVVSPEKEISQLAKIHKKPSFIIEHGFNACSDYKKDYYNDISKKTSMQFISDHFFSWGDYSRELMIENGVSKDSVHTVGCPIVWDYSYIYKCENEKLNLKHNLGDSIIDPETKKRWELLEAYVSLPEIKRDSTGNRNSNLIIFMPFHDWRDIGVENTRKVWDKIKHLPNVYVCASLAYKNTKPENPFKELMEIKDYSERVKKIICPDIRSQQNIELLKNLFQNAGLIITTITGTPNCLAWAMDVPTLVPDLEWGMKYKSKKYNFKSIADYTCNLDSIENKISDIFNNDNKESDRIKSAKYYLGIDKGNPAENMARIIDSVIM